MESMGLTAKHKREAMRLFNIGATPGFDITTTLESFKDICGKRTQLVRILMMYLMNIALTDHQVDEKEEVALRRSAKALNFSGLIFEQLLKMMRAQHQFSNSDYQHSGRTATDTLKDAYETLDVNATIHDKTLKKAYRQLISEYHPDKLVGQSVPDDMIKVATVRSQETQAVYQTIKKPRLPSTQAA